LCGDPQGSRKQRAGKAIATAASFAVVRLT
jgi:hypothetical protein